MKKPQQNTRSGRLIAWPSSVTSVLTTLLGLLASAAVSHAATVNLVGNDGLGASSFNTKQNWADGLPPSAGKDYNTAGFFMRTPGDAGTSYVFAGDSLTLGTNAGASGSMLEKFTLGVGSVRTLTINNFTNRLGAILRSGGTAGAHGG